MQHVTPAHGEPLGMFVSPRYPCHPTARASLPGFKHSFGNKGLHVFLNTWTFKPALAICNPLGPTTTVTGTPPPRWKNDEQARDKMWQKSHVPKNRCGGHANHEVFAEKNHKIASIFGPLPVAHQASTYKTTTITTQKQTSKHDPVTPWGIITGCG